MEEWFFIAVFIVFCVLALPMLIGLSKVVLDHKQKMATLQGENDESEADHGNLHSEYQEFVLGVDARLQKIEERLRLVEGRLRQSGDTGESQQIRRDE